MLLSAWFAWKLWPPFARFFSLSRYISPAAADRPSHFQHRQEIVYEHEWIYMFVCVCVLCIFLETAIHTTIRILTECFQDIFRGMRVN